MFTTLFSIALFVALFRIVFAQGSNFAIDTPTMAQCQPAQITWTDTGNGPYDLLIVSADDMCGESLEDLGNQTSLAVTWTVNFAAGTQIVLSLEDAVGNEAWSGAITVGGSNDTSCLQGSSSAATPTRTVLSVPPSGGAASTTSSHSSPTSSAVPPAGAANAGLAPASGALSTRPLSAVTLVSSVMLAALAFAL